MTLATLTEAQLLEAIDLHEEAVAATRSDTAEERRLIGQTQRRLAALYAELQRRAPGLYALGGGVS